MSSIEHSKSFKTKPGWNLEAIGDNDVVLFGAVGSAKLVQEALSGSQPIETLVQFAYESREYKLAILFV